MARLIVIVETHQFKAFKVSVFGERVSRLLNDRHHRPSLAFSHIVPLQEPICVYVAHGTSTTACTFLGELSL